MPLPIHYKVDFDIHLKDLVDQALSRLLSQHYNKCVLRQFVAVFLRECQELFEACLDIQRLRTVYDAEGENLEGLGRIVGEERAPWTYSEDYFFFFDRQGQGFDQVVMWCLHAPLGVQMPVDDLQYKMNIILKAIKNHTLTSSVPEILDFLDLALDIHVSYDKIGPNEVMILVPASTPMTYLYLLTHDYDDERADHRFWTPYPATLDISSIMFVPDGGFFIFDVWEKEEPVDGTLVKFTERAWDIAPVAVKSILNL